MSNRDYNLSILMGNLARDPEQRPLGGGKYVCAFTVICSNSYRNAQQELIEESMPIGVEAFGRTGELCAQHLRKGSRVMVDGRLKYSTWTDAQGQKKSRHVIVVSEVKFLDGMQHSERDDAQDGVAGEIAPTPLPPSPAGTADEPPF